MQGSNLRKCHGVWTRRSSAELNALDSGTVEYWCAEDDCPAAICGGPHVLYVNSQGDECLCAQAVTPPPGFIVPAAGYVRLKDRECARRDSNPHPPDP